MHDSSASTVYADIHIHNMYCLNTISDGKDAQSLILWSLHVLTTLPALYHNIVIPLL